MESIMDIGVKLIVALQGAGNWLTIPMQIFSFFGTEIFFILLIPLIYWCINARTGLKVGVSFLVSLSVNHVLKLAFQGLRPYWYSREVMPLSTEDTFGVPSGHAQYSTGFWGMIAVSLRKKWVWIAVIVLLFFIGLSRLYLGVHFPHDVLAGWLVGGLILWLIVRFWDPVSSRLDKHGPGVQILLSFCASLLLIGIGLVSFLWCISQWHLEPEWAEFIKKAITMNGIITGAGTLFGLTSGAVVMNRLGGFSADGPLWKRILRFPLGFAGVALFYFSLDVLFKMLAGSGETLVPYLLRYVRYALIGGWVSLGAPWLFRKLKLADKSGKGAVS
jgi:membrane-associated phospholipid phosphatase